jgi:hypothetical protein
MGPIRAGPGFRAMTADCPTTSVSMPYAGFPCKQTATMKKNKNHNFNEQKYKSKKLPELFLQSNLLTLILFTNISQGSLWKDDKSRHGGFKNPVQLGHPSQAFL